MIDGSTMNLCKTFVLITSVSIFTLCAGQSANSTAQSVQRIAAIVNDELITEYDLEARLKFVVFSTRLPNKPEVRKRIRLQVLRSLIDEKLRLQETRRRNIAVSKREIKRAKHLIERQNRLPKNTLGQFLGARNIPVETLEARLRATVAWTKLVRKRLRPRITIGEDEIDEVIDRIRSRQGETEFNLNEILLSIDHPTEEASVYKMALRIIQQVRVGADFSAIARQFSQSATGAAGGKVGWIQESELSSVARKAVSKIKPGELTTPIRAVGGYRILMLKDVRKGEEALRTPVIVGLREILLPLHNSSTASEIKAKLDLANNIDKKIKSCAEFNVVADMVGSIKSTKLARYRLDQLNPRIRSAVKTVSLGKFSRPMRMPNGIMVIMVCERKGGHKKQKLPSRTAVSERLLRDRLTLMIRRYMRDIRLSAIIDIRV